MAKPTPEQLAKINRMKPPDAPDLTEEQVYVHQYLMIGTKFISSRNLQIDESLLPVYLRNIESGNVVHIADHSFSAGLGGIIPRKPVIPFGRYFEGEIKQEGEDYQLYGRRYMVAGMPTYLEMSTDDIDKMCDTGILRDSSVSISWGLSECSICGNDIRDYENCKHYPGRAYKVNDVDMKCFVIAKPKPQNDTSAMFENSDVVAGAYGDARVNPKQALSANGEKPPNIDKLNLNNIADLKLVNKDAPVFCCLSSTSATFQIKSEDLRDASELHQLYHDMYSDGELPEGWTMAKLTQKHKECVKELLDAGHDHLMQDALDGTLNETLKSKSTKGSEHSMTDEEKQGFEAQIATYSEKLKDSLTKNDELTAEIVELTAKVDKLTPQAELGKKYREDAITVALASGVRDQGNDFDEETYKEMFATLDIEKVKSFAEKWESSAVAKLGIPGSHTQGEDLKLPGADDSKPTVDPSLYRVGR